MSAAALHRYLEQTYAEFQKKTTRVKFLYSDFAPTKFTNPLGYEANITTWKTWLKDSAHHGLLGTDGNVLSFEANELEEKLSWNGLGRPLALQSVLTELLQHRDIISSQDIQYLGQQDTWPQWFFSNLVKEPLFWSLRRLQLVDTNVNPRGTYIVVDAFKSVCEDILQRHMASAHFSTDHLMTLADFTARYASTVIPGVTLSHNDIQLVLTYLQRQNRALLAEPFKDDMIIKFKPSGQPNKALFITETDRGVLTVKEASRKLTTQVQEIEEKSNALYQKAARYISNKSKTQALFCLRQRKQLQMVLEKRLSSLSVIDGILLKIQSAESDVEVMEAYSIGADTLQKVIKQSGLTVDGIEAVTDRVYETLADHKDIDDAMGSATEQLSQSLTADIDDDELNRELDQYIQEEAAKKPLPQSPTPAISSARGSSPISESRSLLENSEVPTPVPSSASQVEQPKRPERVKEAVPN